MKVKATLKQGQYGFVGGERRYNNDEFEVSKSDFSESWMIPIKPEKPKRPLKRNAKEGGE